MCVGQVARVAASPPASATGRAAMLGGIGGLVASMSRKKKPGAQPAAPVLEPTAGLGNSSNFNKWGY